jgi:hypothetical protein
VDKIENSTVTVVGTVEVLAEVELSDPDNPRILRVVVLDEEGISVDSDRVDAVVKPDGVSPANKTERQIALEAIEECAYPPWSFGW